MSPISETPKKRRVSMYDLMERPREENTLARRVTDEDDLQQPVLAVSAFNSSI